MSFVSFLNQFKDHEQFISASMDNNTQTEGVERINGERFYVQGHPAYILDVSFISGKSILNLQFEGPDLEEMLEHATDHVNLILAVSSIQHG